MRTIIEKVSLQRKNQMKKKFVRTIFQIVRLHSYVAYDLCTPFSKHFLTPEFLNEECMPRGRKKEEEEKMCHQRKPRKKKKYITYIYIQHKIIFELSLDMMMMIKPRHDS